MGKKLAGLYIAIAILLIICITAGLALLYKEVIVPDQNYKTAISLIEEKDYVSAYELLNRLGDYKDSRTKKEEIYDLYKVYDKIASMEIGETLCFGEYEQDNNFNNGSEKIEWIVLAKERGRALVISKYALDAQPYHSDYSRVYWETSALRQWLNDSFLSVAFSTDEQAQIVNAYVPAHEFEEYATTAGNPTYDHLFLLSFAEIHEYMPEHADRLCPVTEYAKAQGVYESARGACRWWTRTAGGLQDRAAIVRYDGQINPLGCFVDIPNYGVRPAMWIGA